MWGIFLSRRRPAKLSREHSAEGGRRGKAAKPRGSRMCPARCWACDVEQPWGLVGLASETQLALLVITVKILVIIIKINDLLNTYAVLSLFI